MVRPLPCLHRICLEIETVMCAYAYLSRPETLSLELSYGFAVALIGKLEAAELICTVNRDTFHPFQWEDNRETTQAQSKCSLQGSDFFTIRQPITGHCRIACTLTVIGTRHTIMTVYSGLREEWSGQANLDVTEQMMWNTCAKLSCNSSSIPTGSLFKPHSCPVRKTRWLYWLRLSRPIIQTPKTQGKREYCRPIPRPWLFLSVETRTSLKNYNT